MLLLQALILKTLTQSIALGGGQRAELPLNFPQALLLNLRHIVELPEALIDDLALLLG